MTYPLHIIYIIVQLFILSFLGLSLLYLFIFAVAGRFYRRRYPDPEPVIRKIAVLIPAYREDNVIVDVAKDALLQDYPPNRFDVTVIADSLRTDTVSRLNALPIRVVEVSFEQSTKSKALNSALAQLTGDYDVAVILDADNIMATDFLKKVNAAFEEDVMAVQGHRTARNNDTSLAVLDGISEEINNHIFRKGHRALGLSSAIIGSGLAFRFHFFKEMMLNIKAVGGFDKEIELIMLRKRMKIEYLEDALVYDEKVSKTEVFTNQRRRWLSAQFAYFRRDIGSAMVSLIREGNIDYFDKALQFVMLPRILLLGMTLAGSIAFSLFNLYLGLPPAYSYCWMAILFLCLFTFILSIPRKFYTLHTLNAMAGIPKGMFLMVVSLLRIRGANRQFLHTEHGVQKPGVSSIQGPNQ
jgi:cellulose synthase/poly-beta-1,6-N-acetylglucosamine synthase-like glycosyltransferase